MNAALELVDNALNMENAIFPINPDTMAESVMSTTQPGYGSTRYTDATLAADPDVKLEMSISYGTVDKCIAYTEHYITAAGFPLKWQNAPNTTLAAMQAATVFGWNTPALTAPDALFCMAGGTARNRIHLP